MKNRSIKNTKRPFQKPREAKSVLDMSESEMLAIGYRNPLVKKYDFKHSDEEKKKLKKLRFKGPTNSPGMPRPKRSELEANLILHIKPTGKDDYKSTVTYKAKPSEIGYILGTLVIKDSIAKAYYNGKPYKVAA